MHSYKAMLCCQHVHRLIGNISTIKLQLINKALTTSVDNKDLYLTYTEYEIYA